MQQIQDPLVTWKRENCTKFILINNTNKSLRANSIFFLLKILIIIQVSFWKHFQLFKKMLFKYLYKLTYNDLIWLFTLTKKRGVHCNQHRTSKIQTSYTHNYIHLYDCRIFSFSHNSESKHALSKVELLSLKKLFIFATFAKNLFFHSSITWLTP